MAPFKQIEDIEAWQMGRRLFKAVYECCHQGALAKEYYFRDQLCGAALSIPANIAEGFGRRTDKEFARFLSIAKGSATELMTLLYLAKDTELITEVQFKDLHNIAASLTARIAGLIQYLKAQQKS